LIDCYLTQRLANSSIIYSKVVTLITVHGEA